MKSNLHPTPNMDRAQPSMGFQSPVHPFDAGAPVIDHLPLGCHLGLGDQSLVLRIRQDDGFCPILTTDDVIQMPTGVAGSQIT